MSLQERSDTVLKFAKVLVDNGETTGEAAAGAERLAKTLGVTAEILPGWRDIALEASDGKEKLASTVRASPTGISMNRVSSATRTINQAATTKIPLSQLERTIDKISRTPPDPIWLFAIGAAGGAVALSVLFGVEHLLTVAIIAASAGVGAVMRRAIGKYTDNPFIQPFCAALLAGAIGAVAVIYNLSSDLRLIAICPCLVLVPGPHVLNGMIDLLQARISLAVSRLVYAGFILLAISAGVLLTFSILHVSLPVEPAGRAIPFVYDVLAAGAAAAAYSIFYSTPARMIGWSVVVGMIAHAIRYETLAAGGSIEAASLVAALFVGLVMTPIVRVRHMPFAGVGFACVVSMIPGVYVIRAASGFVQLINGSSATSQVVLPTLSDGVTAVGVTLALAFGLVVPKVVIDHFMSRMGNGEKRRIVRGN
jgi:uncharacterized membrane protein YjjP (DUF1212 family)